MTGRRDERGLAGVPPPQDSERVRSRPSSGPHNANPTDVNGYGAAHTANGVDRQAPPDLAALIGRKSGGEQTARPADGADYRNPDKRFAAVLLLFDLRLDSTSRSPLGAFASPKRPLARDIAQQIAARYAAPAEIITAVLKRWRRRSDYLAAVARGDACVELDGELAGLPSAEERERAAKALAKREGRP